MLSGGTQRQAQLTAGFWPCFQSKEMKILINNNLFPQVEIEPATVALQSHPCATAAYLSQTGLGTGSINTYS